MNCRIAELSPTTTSPVTDLKRFLEGHLKVDLDLYADLPADVLGLTGSTRTSALGYASIRGCHRRHLKPIALLQAWLVVRTTLAHEASRVMLHRVLFVKDLAQDQLFTAPDVRESVDPLMRCLKRDVGYGTGTGDWREIQANVGMAALLMPRRIFRRLWLSRDAELAANKDRDTELSRRLSERCGVSRQAVSIRLSTLDLLPKPGTTEMFVSIELGRRHFDKPWRRHLTNRQMRAFLHRLHA